MAADITSDQHLTLPEHTLLLITVDLGLSSTTDTATTRLVSSSSKFNITSK